MRNPDFLVRRSLEPRLIGLWMHSLSSHTEHTQIGLPGKSLRNGPGCPNSPLKLDSGSIHRGYSERAHNRDHTWDRALIGLSGVSWNQRQLVWAHHRGIMRDSLLRYGHQLSVFEHWSGFSLIRKSEYCCRHCFGLRNRKEKEINIWYLHNAVKSIFNARMAGRACLRLNCASLARFG